jgi:hypothetical protein
MVIERFKKKIEYRTYIPLLSPYTPNQRNYSNSGFVARYINYCNAPYTWNTKKRIKVPRDMNAMIYHDLLIILRCYNSKIHLKKLFEIILSFTIKFMYRSIDQQRRWEDRTGLTWPDLTLLYCHSQHTIR